MRYGKKLLFSWHFIKNSLSKFLVGFIVHSSVACSFSTVCFHLTSCCSLSMVDPSIACSWKFQRILWHLNPFLFKNTNIPFITCPLFLETSESKRLKLQKQRQIVHFWLPFVTIPFLSLSITQALNHIWQRWPSSLQAHRVRCKGWDIT